MKIIKTRLPMLIQLIVTVPFEYFRANFVFRNDSVIRTCHLKGLNNAKVSLRRRGACVTKAPLSAKVKKENSTPCCLSQVTVTSPRKKSASWNAEKIWKSAGKTREIQWRMPTRRWMMPSTPLIEPLLPTPDPCEWSGGSKYSYLWKKY